MRAPRRRLIPTESFVLAFGIGALVPILMQLTAYLLDQPFLYTWAYLLSPFVSGFCASVVFGPGREGSVGRTLLVGFLAFPVYFSVLFAGWCFIAFGGSRGINPGPSLILISVVHPFFLIAIIMSIIGAVLGRTMFAIGLER